MIIAVDMTGADKGPSEVYEGIRLALRRNVTLRVVPTGPKEFVDLLKAEFGDRVVAGYHDEASDKRTNSASAKGIRLLDNKLSDARNGLTADAAVFFGNTKWPVYWASIGREKGGLDLLPGIILPPLALTMPTYGGLRKVYMDAGVSVDDVTAEMLYQFAWLGRAFAQVELGILNPKLSPHSNGEEPEKGNKLTKDFFKLLTDRKFPGFVGHNAQMTDLIANVIDVLVSDGFGGNKSFKSVEAGVRLVLEALKRHIKSKFIYKLLARLLKSCFDKVKAELDSSEFGCQPLLGIDNAIVGIGHGSADRYAIANGIERAMHFVEIKLAQRIKELIPATL